MRSTVVAFLILVPGTLPTPAQAVLAEHEDTCAEAVKSGNHNVVSGPGRIVGTTGDDIICCRSGNDDLFGGSRQDDLSGGDGAPVRCVGGAAANADRECETVTSASCRWRR